MLRGQQLWVRLRENKEFQARRFLRSLCRIEPHFFLRTLCARAGC